MGFMFSSCSSLISIDLSNFNCDNIKTIDKMENMFKECKKLKNEKILYKDFKIRNQLLIDLK